MWAWFIGTKVGRGLIALGGVLLAIGAAAWQGFEKGKYREARKNAARRAKEAADAAKVARDTYTAADAAAAEVRKQAEAAPPPDAGKRDDFDNSF